MNVLPTPPTPPAAPQTDAAWMALIVAQIHQAIAGAGGSQLAAYNRCRLLVYGNGVSTPRFTSDQIYAALEAAKAGDANAVGLAARIAKTVLLKTADPADPRIIALAADPVPVLKILDPLNPPANLSTAAQAAFAEIAAAL